MSDLEQLKNREKEQISSHKGSLDELEEMKKGFAKEKIDLNKKAQPTYFRFRCKYFIPDASDVIRDEQPGGRPSNIYVQVSCANERLMNKARELAARERS